MRKILKCERSYPDISRGFSHPLMSQRPADNRQQQASKRIPDQCFDRSPIAPVAISASHDALPRSGAWHL
jgi:hypothetical protein